MDDFLVMEVTGREIWSGTRTAQSRVGLRERRMPGHVILAKHASGGVTGITEKLHFNAIKSSNVTLIGPEALSWHAFRASGWFRHTFPCRITPSEPGNFDPHTERESASECERLIWTRHPLIRLTLPSHGEARRGKRGPSNSRHCARTATLRDGASCPG